MKYKITALLLVLLLLLCGVLVGCKTEPYVGADKTDTLRGRALQLGRALIDNYVYYDGGVPCVAEKVSTLFRRKLNVASVWHVTAVIAATNYLTEMGGADGKYFADVNAQLWGSLTYYAGTAEICTYGGKSTERMYAVNRADAPEQADISGINAVYDDQMWLVRELIASYRNTGKADYLTQAETLAQTCLDGWDCTLRPDGTEYGGITWGAGYASKHTCSNAPMIAPLVDLYDIYAETDSAKAAYYIDFAVKIYDFCRNTFVNDYGVYGDLVGSEFITRADGTKQTTSQGTLDQTAYTYNTGTVLQGAAKLYAATNDEQYLTYARSLADLSYKYFMLNETLDYDKRNSNTWFDFQLLLGYVELVKVVDDEHKETAQSYVDHFESTLTNAYNNFYSNGLLPDDLDGGWGFESQKNVLDAAACVEMLAVLYLNL